MTSFHHETEHFKSNHCGPLYTSLTGISNEFLNCGGEFMTLASAVAAAHYVEGNFASAATLQLKKTQITFVHLLKSIYVFCNVAIGYVYALRQTYIQV